MDIRILSAAGNAQPRSAPPAQPDATNGSFARSLEQATSKGRSEQPVANRTETRAAATEPKPSESQASNEMRPPATRPLTPSQPPAAQELLPQQPPQVELATDVIAQAPVEDTALLASNPANLEDVASRDPADGASEQSDTLDEIRRRLALIEQAGQLPTDAIAASAPAAALVVVPQADASTPPDMTTKATDGDSQHALDPLLHRFAGIAGDNAFQAVQQPAATAAEPDAVALTASSGGQDTDLAAQAGDTPVRSESTPTGLFAPNGSTLAPSSGASPTATSTPPTLSAPLASSEWQQSLGQQLIGLHQRGEHSIELHLHPHELGPLSVSLKLGELGAQAQFLSAHPQVRAAVEQAIPQLREALASQGISLGETSVGEQRQPARDQQSGDNSNQRPAVTLQSSDEQRSAAPATLAPLSGRGRVDLYA